MTKAPPTVSTFECALFGGITISRTDSSVTAALASESGPTAVINRTGPRTRPKMPIGTRDPAQLTGSIGGEQLIITPGRGRLVKRSYRVELRAGETVWCLAPRTLTASQLLRGAKDMGNNEFGEFEANLATGVIDVVWAAPFTFQGQQVVPPEPSLTDALAGYAAAAAFGTGGLALVPLLGELVAIAVPG